MGRSLEDGVLVVLKDFEPVANIVGVVCPNLRGDAEVGTEERGAQFCDLILTVKPNRERLGLLTAPDNDADCGLKKPWRCRSALSRCVGDPASGRYVVAPRGAFPAARLGRHPPRAPSSIDDGW